MGLGTVVQIGWRAAAALAADASDVHVLAPVGASIYIVAAGEILWLAGPTGVMHSRAIVLSEAPDAAAYRAGERVSVPPWHGDPWHPPVPTPIAGATARPRLEMIAASLGAPEGFGAWLLGEPLTFPLGGAAGAADALAAACARDDAPAATEAALTLLGLGAGLTPSGDDFVGGAFFARAVLAASRSAAWTQAATSIRGAAAQATNAISATLLGDLIEGDGWSPLHDLAGALVSGDDARALSAARRLTGLGHSSGWDVLAGLAAGIAR
jgi:hypothetical protein